MTAVDSGGAKGPRTTESGTVLPASAPCPSPLTSRWGTANCRIVNAVPMPVATTSMIALLDGGGACGDGRWRRPLPLSRAPAVHGRQRNAGHTPPSAVRLRDRRSKFTSFISQPLRTEMGELGCECCGGAVEAALGGSWPDAERLRRVRLRPPEQQAADDHRAMIDRQGRAVRSGWPARARRVPAPRSPGRPTTARRRRVSRLIRDRARLSPTRYTQPDGLSTRLTFDQRW